MVFGLYLIVLASSLGFVNLAPLTPLSSDVGKLNAADILLAILAIVTLPGYLRERKKFVMFGASGLELAWVGFIIVVLLASYYSPASSLRERFVNLRFARGFILFFPTVAVISTESRLKAILRWGIVFALIGTLITIAQSLHGLTNLFDSDYYDIGDWVGNKQMVGGLARVNLPVSNWVAFVLLVLFADNLIRSKWTLICLSGILFVTILLNFARSLWLGLFAGFFVEFLYFYRLGLLTSRSLARLAMIPFAIILAVFAADALGIGDLIGAISYRLDEGLFFFKSGSGTWGVRMIDTDMAFKIWGENWLWGLGTAYQKVLGRALDMGIAIVLVSMGAIGLLTLCVLLFKSWQVGWNTLKWGLISNSHWALLAGAALIGQVTLMIVYQQWLNPYVAPILGVSGGVCVSRSVRSSPIPYLNGDDGEVSE